MIRVVVADDQAVVRLGLRYALESQGDVTVVAEVADGAYVPAAVARTDPDVVVMDVRMPLVDGIEATARLAAGRRAGSRPAVLILTTFALDEYLAGALRAGATGFVLKDASPAVLVTAVRAVASGAVFIEPAMAPRLATAVHAVPAHADIDRLSERERQVLSLLGAGHSNADIAAALVLEESTVKTHVHRILTKLGLRNRTQAAVVAQSVKLR